MKKRRKPLIDSIHRFNLYVDKLRSSKQPEWNIAIPSKLPVDLKELQEDPDLLEDVWIAQSKSPSDAPPKWFTDVNVRRGIKAQLKLDRCVEERMRLDFEGSNMIRWYEEELCTLLLANRLSQGEYFLTFIFVFVLNVLRDLGSVFYPRLGTRLYEHKLYAKRWESPFCTPSNFLDAEDRASKVVDKIVLSGLSNIEKNDMKPPLSATPIRKQYPEVRLEVEQELLPVDGVEGIVGDFHEIDEMFAANEDPLEEILEALDLAEDDYQNDNGTRSPPIFEIVCNWEFKTNRGLCDNLSDILPKIAHPTKMLFPDRVDVKSRYRRETESQPFRGNISIYSEEIAALAPNRWLTGSLINELCKLLQERFDLRKRCAIFNTFTLKKHFDPNKSFSDQFISAFSYTQFLDRNIWIFPLNRTQPYQHWTLVLLDIENAEVLHFDSLAVKHFWEEDVLVCIILTFYFIV
jgi:hypothetical protein